MSAIATAVKPPLTSPLQRTLILAVVLVADILDLLDSTITNIAAPTIADALGGGQQLIQWAGASYALALGVLLVVGGRLGDKFGRRRTFLIGLIGFTAASAACGVALNPEMFIAGRIVQGAFGALLIPQGFGILLAAYPREEVGKAFSAFGPAMGIAAVGGPILAGFLIHADLFGLGWRPMFLINLVIGVAAIVAALLVVPRDRGDRSVVLDGLGAGLLSVAMLGLLSGLIEGSSTGWGPVPFTLIGLGIIGSALFVRRQRVAKAPIISPSLLRNRGFTSGLIMGVLFFAAVAGLLYTISLFVQGVLHVDALGAALALAPVATGLIVASIVSGILMGKLGRGLVLIGLLLTLAGTAWAGLIVLAAGATVGTWALVGPLVLVGLGMGACFGTIFSFALGDIDAHETGSASGSLNAVQQLANAAGSAAITTVFFAVSDAPSVNGMLASLAVVGAVVLLCCFLVRLLPRTAQPQEH
ncbi:DHA2 family efflux MFS transporter permease subunit [Cellulomonas sp. P22]|uniref:DHA2 family efflux MFS transporter permease subunit n=1 Tax=Cellulomonas sp. P22 TaxID=3373189 RepID=UPI0037906552